MKKIILLAFVAFSINTYAQWVPIINQGPICGSLEPLEAVGLNLFGGTFCNPGSDIYLSLDEGYSWNSVGNGLPFFQYIYSTAIDGGNIFLGIGDSLNAHGLFFSSNYGSNWNSVNLGIPGNIYITSLKFVDPDIFAGVAANGVYKSNDNGNTWINAGVGLSNANQFYDFAFTGSNIFVGTNVGVFKSTNHGSSWIPINAGLPSNSYFTNLCSIGSTVLAATWQREVYRTTDYGNSWSLVYDENTYISDMITSGSKVYLSTYNYVMMSPDSGLTWINIGTFNSNLSDLAASSNFLFASESACFVNAQTWMIPLSQLTSLEENSSMVNFTIFPNPFSLQTNINFVDEQKNAEILIIDMMGKTVKSFYFSGNLITIEKGLLSSGNYFIKVTDDKKNVVNKRLVIE